VKTSATLLALLCLTAFAQQKGTFTDTRDGKKYKTVKIGEQAWMENLNYEAEGSRCYNDSTSNCKKYGRLYDWATAMKACPKGWHLPSNDEWDKLYRYVDVTNGTDKFGFSALPGGGGYSGGDFYGVGHSGYWWSSTEYGSNYAYGRLMNYYGESVYWFSIDKNYLLSIRCVQD
jgi:uncharacterized protein (TIGR02145 family)